MPVVGIRSKTSVKDAQELLLKILKSVKKEKTSSSANDYWTTINSTMLDHSPEIKSLWQNEDQAATEGREFLKAADLEYIDQRKNEIAQMSKEELLSELLLVSKFESKIDYINKVVDSGIFDIK